VCEEEFFVTRPDGVYVEDARAHNPANFLFSLTYLAIESSRKAEDVPRA